MLEKAKSGLANRSSDVKKEARVGKCHSGLVIVVFFLSNEICRRHFIVALYLLCYSFSSSSVDVKAVPLKAWKKKGLGVVLSPLERQFWYAKRLGG